MSLSERIPQPVQWHEGMFLSPHHFQQQQIYYDKMLCHVMGQAHPDYWGIYELEVDQSQLASGRVIVNKLHCVMKDGLVIQYEAERDDRGARPVLDLKLDECEDIEEDQRFITIQVAVPVRGVAAARSASAEAARFLSEEDPAIPDENTGDNPVGVCRLRPRLSLVAREKTSSSFSSIPLLRIDRRSGDVCSLADYEPPMLRMVRKEFVNRESLAQRIASVLRDVRIKADRLSRAARNQQGSAINDLQAMSIAAMVAGLPGLEVLLTSGTAHPSQVYQAVAQLAGQMAALHRGCIPPELPPYRHEDMEPGFTRALDFIEAELARVNLSHTSIPVDKDDKNVFRLLLEEAWQDRSIVLELKSARGVDDDNTRRWLRHCLIATDSTLGALSKSRLLGASAESIDGDMELDIHSHSGTVLCRITWQEPFIRPGETLTISCTESDLADYAPEGMVYFRPFDSVSNGGEQA